MNPSLQRRDAYRQTQIHTASKEQLVLMLYDGVIRFSEQGRQAILDKNIEKKQFALVRSQDIIFELVNGLDHEKGGEIAANLARLYAYAIKRLVDANLKNDTAGIDETQDIFRNLREAWAVAMTQVNREKAEGKAPVIEHTAPTAAVPPTTAFDVKSAVAKPAAATYAPKTPLIGRNFTGNYGPAKGGFSAARGFAASAAPTTGNYAALNAQG
ncbi:hypothetical protein FACS1894107_09940 [Planctomycetales bacterium]|nr:hypothetical protein FACS1894107_09940 [Planctomycetales bacterium]GHS96849.1 hypothetical protein FACS1894108_02210 [Planctomycetales bacterium]